REAMEAGAFGFTTTTSRNHVGYQGRPLACRNASRDELVGGVRGLADVGRGAVEIILSSGGMYGVSDDDGELLRGITEATGRPAAGRRRGWRSSRTPASRITTTRRSRSSATS